MNKLTKKTKKPAAAVVKTEPVNTPVLAAQPEAKAEPQKPAPGKISLTLTKPGASQVYVAGSFNGWKAEANPLKPAGKDRWVGDLTVTPGRHEYLFVVDGQWLPDPNAAQTVQNPFGGHNSVLVVSE